MKFNKSLNLLLVSLEALLVNSEKVTFKVLAVNGTPTLNIEGGQQYKMNVKEYPLYTVEADINSFPVKYNYILNYDNGQNEIEEFMRQRNKDDDSLNEFFNRSVTVLEHPQLPKAYKAFPHYVPSKLYDDTHIATIIVKCDPNDLQGLYQNLDDEGLKINAEVIYANPYGVKTYKNTYLSLGGQSTKHAPKLSYKIKNLKNDKNKELFNRSSIKLRAEHMDPSFLRDKLYGDILNSLGVPAAQNKLARLFINGEAIGLFDITDPINNNRYLRETFNKGKKYKNENPIFKADYCYSSCSDRPVYGDLGYYGDDATNPMYSIYTYKGEDKSSDSDSHFINELLPLIKDINAYTSGATDKMPFDIDIFLRYMAMEYLAGAIDNYWNKPGNYYVFKDLSKDQWYFHDTDFHFSFGVGGDEDLMLNTPLSNYPPTLDDGVERSRPPLDSILSHSENKEKFVSIFDRLLKTSFHPKAILPRLDSLANLIREDAYWDFTLPRVSQSDSQIDTDLIFEKSDFDSHVSNEEPEARYGNMPIKYFINTKSDLLAKELGIMIPENFENDLGYVENPNQTSNANAKMIWSIYTILISFCLAMILY
ncbi:hypothetical protein BCR36DRAFT_347431 [Piromyces finnis]|uniref:Coth-domain-containing protein n=1 Tax=Piromyces finnis TaxID=1754191 RepID=A0A1Y1VGF5_9FUNG|nr:hypothetical protein BCR36DRAFT_347431 [Piromyces finnis]|eukprot:ORX55495.1 hypothetical protein BCR36DRAFT_347431 [Piromyces finnis]